MVFQPSSGYCSSIGRCFSAAAWKTTSGRCSRRRVDAASSRMSQSTRSVGVEQAGRRRQLHGVQGGLVAVEQHEFPGTERRTWRASSDPIDPPAPVTNTTLPVRKSAICGQVGLDRPATEEVGDVEPADIVEPNPAGDHLAGPAARPRG